MRPIASYLVECKDRYNNKIDVEGNELIVNAEISEKDFIYVNRIGKIKEIPLINDGDLNVGDEILVHHNVFRRWYDMRGREKNTNSFYKDDLYLVNTDQIFAKYQNKEWKASNGFIFVEPIVNTQSSEAFQSHSSHFKELCGRIYLGDDKYPPGTSIAFTPDSEYEFELDGKKLYRIMKNQITFIWTLKNKENQ